LAYFSLLINSFVFNRKCFPEYQGKDDYTEASEYIQAQFVAQNKSEQKVCDKTNIVYLTKKHFVLFLLGNILSFNMCYRY
jgi:hypothetical protein